MESFQFTCPYCSGEFALGERPVGEAVACPHCGGAVALPPAWPSPVEEPPPAPPIQPPVANDFVAHADAAAESPSALDFLGQPTELTRSQPPRPPRQPTLPPNVRRLSREEKDRRRLRRNLVLMAVGTVVLAVAAAVLSRV